MNPQSAIPPSAGGAPPRAELLLAGFVFFLSGASALVYQVSWQRILALHTGVGIQSVAIIVAAFMAGLGLGSHLGGVLSGRLSPRAALRVFAALELAIGVFGALSCVFYYDWLYLRAHWTFGSTWRTALHHLAALGLPTTLMGMSLPFLVHGMVREARTAYRTIGVLYAVNVFGASLGALATPWVLIPRVGIRGAVLAAAAINLVAAVGALVLARRVPARGVTGDAAASVTPPADPDPDAPAGRPFGLWLALYALSGFGALALEIVWFRIIDVGVKATAYTFGTVLAVYLAGLAAGTLAGVRVMARVRRPLQAFLLCQCLLLAYAALAILLVATLRTDAPIYNDYARYWARNRTFILGIDRGLTDVFRLYLAWPAFLFGLPTFLMGLSFTALHRAVHDDVRTSGRKVGLLQAANIAGNVAGSLAVGLISLTAIGTTGTMKVLTAVGLVFAGTGLVFSRRRWPFALLAGVLALLVVAGPKQTDLWTRLHGLYEAGSLVEEDATSVVSIRPWIDGKSELWINGRRHSLLPLWWDPHGAGGAARGHPPRAPDRRRGGPRIRRHPVGGRLPSRDRARHRLRDLLADPAAAPGLRGAPSAGGEPRGVPGRPSRHPAGRGRPQRPGPLRGPLRHHRDGRAPSRERVQRQPVLGGVLSPGRVAPGARWPRLGLGGHAARRRDLPARVSPRPLVRGRRDPDRRQSAFPRRARDLEAAHPGHAGTGVPRPAQRGRDRMMPSTAGAPSRPRPLRSTPNRDLFPRDEFGVRE